MVAGGARRGSTALQLAALDADIVSLSYLLRVAGSARSGGTAESGAGGAFVEGGR